MRKGPESNLIHPFQGHCHMPLLDVCLLIKGAFKSQTTVQNHLNDLLKSIQLDLNDKPVTLLDNNHIQFTQTSHF